MLSDESITLEFSLFSRETLFFAVAQLNSQQQICMTGKVGGSGKKAYLDRLLPDRCGKE